MNVYVMDFQTSEKRGGESLRAALWVRLERLSTCIVQVCKVYSVLRRNTDQ